MKILQIDIEWDGEDYSLKVCDRAGVVYRTFENLKGPADGLQAVMTEYANLGLDSQSAMVGMKEAGK